MAVTGQISIARVGSDVQIFEDVEDIIPVFDPNQKPNLKEGDHVTLYPGDFTQALDEENQIAVREGIFLTILPGAIIGYDRISGGIEDRYLYVDEEETRFENIADLNIADQYTTQVGKQGGRVRVYSNETLDFSGKEDPAPVGGAQAPYSSYGTLDGAAAVAEEGDTILVYPGAYKPENNLFIDGVDWYFFDGAKVIYEKEFFDSNDELKKYPHALFDDLRNVDGSLNVNPGKTCNVYGEGSFRVGTLENLPAVSETNEEYEDSKYWEDWNLFSLLAINNNGSCTFEAKEVAMVCGNEAALKLSSGKDVSVDIGKVTAADNLGTVNSGGDPYTTVPAIEAPAFCYFNGAENGTSREGKFSISVEEYDIQPKQDEQNFCSFFVGVEDSVYSSSNRLPFEGEVELSVGKSFADLELGGGTQSGRKYVRAGNGFSPKFLKVKESSVLKGNFGLFIDQKETNSQSQVLPVTKFVIQNSEFSTEEIFEEPNLTLSGNPDGYELILDNAILHTGEAIGSYSSVGENQYSIKNATTDSSGNKRTDFNIKVYGSSFTDSPFEDFRKILHPELNGVQWSQDVRLLS